MIFYILTKRSNDTKLAKKYENLLEKKSSNMKKYSRVRNILNYKWNKAFLIKHISYASIKF